MADRNLLFYQKLRQQLEVAKKKIEHLDILILIHWLRIYAYQVYFKRDFRLNNDLSKNQ